MSDKATIIQYSELTPDQKVWMFEFIFPEALRQVLAANEVTSYTNFVPPELQKERPRCEITFTPGPGKGSLNPVSQCDAAYTGQYKIDVVTDPDQAIHSAYVTKIRALLGNLTPQINDVPPMKFHNLAYPMRDGGTSSQYSDQQGHYMTTLIREVDFSIQGNAWALLTQ